MRYFIFTLMSVYLLTSLYTNAQTTILTEGFETDGDGSRYEANEFDDGGNDFWTRTNVSPNSGATGNQTYSGWIGSYHWNGEDVDATDNPLGTGQNSAIVFKTLDVSTYQNGNISFEVYIAADSNGIGSWESSDFLLFEYAFDTDIATGGNGVGSLPAQANILSGTYTIGGAFYGATDLLALQEDTDLDGAEDGVRLGNTFVKYTFNWSVPGTASNMSLRIRVNWASFESGGFDEIKVSATSGGSPVSTSITAQTNNICNGDALGSLTVTASDGTTPYTYNWSNTATTATISTLGAGTYTVTVTDAGGTTSTSSATITEPTALNTTISSQTNVACFGESTGSLTASVTGGTSPYTYNWNSGETSATITGKAAGTYTVSVLDNNGCGEGPPP